MSVGHFWKKILIEYIDKYFFFKLKIQILLFNFLTLPFFTSDSSASEFLWFWEGLASGVIVAFTSPVIGTSLVSFSDDLTFENTELLFSFSFRLVVCLIFSAFSTSVKYSYYKHLFHYTYFKNINKTSIFNIKFWPVSNLNLLML